MMKNIFFTVAVSLFVITGCHPGTEPASPVKDASQLSADDAQSAENQKEGKEMKTPKVDSQWSFFFMEKRDNPTSVEEYQRALKLVHEQTNEKGDLRNGSRRLGDWYLIEVKAEERKGPIPMDAPARHDPAFLVDMANERVIQTGDVNALRPIFRDVDLTRHVPNPDDGKEKDYLGSFAALLSAVNFGNTDYIEPIEGQRFPEGVGGPRLSIRGDTAIFTYFIASSGMAYFITKCELTVSPSKFEFVSEVINNL